MQNEAPVRNLVFCQKQHLDEAQKHIRNPFIWFKTSNTWTVKSTYQSSQFALLCSFQTLFKCSHTSLEYISIDSSLLLVFQLLAFSVTFYFAHNGFSPSTSEYLSLSPYMVDTQSFWLITTSKNKCPFTEESVFHFMWPVFNGRKLLGLGKCVCGRNQTEKLTSS